MAGPGLALLLGCWAFCRFAPLVQAYQPPPGKPRRFAARRVARLSVPGLCLGERDELGDVECRLIACSRVAGIAAASI
jgi:predicted alpha/beta-hydrolase family hydrolase